ncbi:MAG: hypothetical protein HQL38_18960 [Alphaproteobacteria bacterium]|nr:hypothetical protein [Alphaproteobacteria bacterium]
MGWRMPPGRLAKRLLSLTVVAGLLPALLGVALFYLVAKIIHWEIVAAAMAQAPLLALLDGGDDGSAAPKRLAKSMLRWSVIAGPAGFVLVLIVGSKLLPSMPDLLGGMILGLSIVAVVQAPLLACMNVAIFVWGSSTCDIEADQHCKRRWANWGMAAVGASLSGPLLLWLLVLLAFRPPID